MANKVRMRESFIMDAIYRASGVFDCSVIDANQLQPESSPVIMEGGDIIVAREDILIIGNGIRTTAQGIDFMIDRFRKSVPYGRYNVIVQQLPSEPESFIHLDMVFTMLDTDKCMVFKPLIMQANQYQTVHIVIEDGNVTSIRPVSGLLSVLKKLGMDLKPIVCGGSDEWDQEREQWHSGANFFAFAPGKVLSYARNIHTLEELSKNGFEVVSANDFISGKADGAVYGDSPCVVTIDGSELPRGGGGARCMTMPLSRNNIV
jgi:arginine deiminase